MVSLCRATGSHLAPSKPITCHCAAYATSVPLLN